MSVWPRLLLLVYLALVPAGQAMADLVVVVNARLGVEKLTRDEVINIFLGRYRSLPNGLAAQPIDQPANHPEKARFYRLLVNKDLAEINAYWTRLIFSGKTSPPRQVKADAQVFEWLANEKGAVAYIERHQLVPGLRIVLDLER